MDFLVTIAATIVTLGLLVTFHEFGHYWVARRCGVKVLRFSVGFGKPLWSRVGRDGTEYVVAAIPLGGYVRMLDEREGPVLPEDRHLAFNNKTVWQRIAIVSAGPIANFLLAIFAFWLMYMIGIRTVVPVIGSVETNTPAASAGLSSGYEVVSVDGQKTPSWYDINLALLEQLGDTGAIELGVKRFESSSSTGSTQYYDLPVKNWLVGLERPDPIASLGIAPWQPKIPPVIGSVIEDSAAAAAGLKVGDRLVSYAGRDIDDWLGWVELIRESAGQELNITVERNGQFRQVTLIPGSRTLENGKTIGFIGAGTEKFSFPQEMLREIRFSPIASIPKALQQTWSMTSLTVDSIGKMITGLISVKNLSGPITIAKVAGSSAKSGIESFLNFLAMLSISLGVLNLLPIPVLDGGHLLFYAIEVVKGKPVSERIQMLGLRIGISVVLVIMCLALYNDLARL